MSAPTAANPPATCCGRKDGGGCVCAQEAKCSCGKQPAMQCNCEKASTENKIIGAACSCNLRPAKMCTCSRAGEENVVTGETCACGKRPYNSCTCAGVETGQSLPTETDFTNMK